MYWMYKTDALNVWKVWNWWIEWMNELVTNVLEGMSLVHWMHVTDELVVSKDVCNWWIFFIKDVCNWCIGGW